MYIDLYGIQFVAYLPRASFPIQTMIIGILSYYLNLTVSIHPNIIIALYIIILYTIIVISLFNHQTLCLAHRLHFTFSQIFSGYALRLYCTLHSM